MSLVLNYYVFRNKIYTVKTFFFILNIFHPTMQQCSKYCHLPGPMEMEVMDFMGIDQPH